MRDRYIERLKFLPPTAAEAAPLMHVESTDYSRTIMSAASQVQGMFPANVWNMNQEPFPIHVPPRSVDESLFSAERYGV